MPGIRDVVAMIGMIGPAAQRAASTVHDATEKIKKDVEDVKRTASTLTDSSPNRDRSKDTGSKTGDSGDSVSAMELAARLQTTRGRFK